MGGKLASEVVLVWKASRQVRWCLHGRQAGGGSLTSDLHGGFKDGEQQDSSLVEEASGQAVVIVIDVGVGWGLKQT